MKKFVKKLTLGGAALAMTAALAACGASAPGSAGPAAAGSDSAQTTGAGDTQGAAQSSGDASALRISWWGGDARHSATLKALDEYMAANPGTKVEAEYGAWSGWQEKIATQLAGNSESDVLQINWNWLYEFSADGNGFYDLNELKDSFDLTQYSDNLLKQMTLHDKLLGIPVATTGRVFYYNKTTWDKAGLELPKSFADLLAAGPVFQEKLGDDYYPMAFGELDLQMLLTYYMQQKYNKPWVTDGELSYTEDELADGFDFLKSLEAAHVIPSQEKLKGDGADSLDKNPNFIDGHYAGIFEWDSAAKKMSDALADGQEFVLGSYPADFGTPATVYKVSMGFAVSKNTKHAEEAASLLQFLLNGDGVKTLDLERGIPASKAAQEQLQAEGKLAGIVFEANKLASANAPFALSPYFEDSKLKDSAEGAYYEIMDNMSYDQTDSHELAQQMLEAVNSVEAEHQSK